MFALFHFVPYEGSDFLGVFSSLELAQAAAHAQVAAADSDEDGWEFHGRLEVFRVELDAGFRLGFLEQPLWVLE
jgi:hypothetical protein